MSYYLGIDIGTSSTKTILISPDGKILAEDSKIYPLYHPNRFGANRTPKIGGMQYARRFVPSSAKRK